MQVAGTIELGKFVDSYKIPDWFKMKLMERVITREIEVYPKLSNNSQFVKRISSYPIDELRTVYEMYVLTNL